MKKLLLLLIFSTFVFSGLQAQQVVSDPGLLAETMASWSKSLEQTYQQFNEMKEQSAMLRENIDRYQKVSKFVKNSKQVYNIIEMQVQIVNNISSQVDAASRNVESEKAYAAFKSTMTGLARASQSNVSRLTMLLKNDELKLSDYERMQMIDEVENRSAAILQSCDYQVNKYKKLNSALAEIKRVTGVK